MASSKTMLELIPVALHDGSRPNLPSPLWAPCGEGRPPKPEAGGVGSQLLTRVASSNNDPHPQPQPLPLVGPRGGGEHTESVATVIESNGTR